jgi:hypothetical protein
MNLRGKGKKEKRRKGCYALQILSPFACSPVRLSAFLAGGGAD